MLNSIKIIYRLVIMLLIPVVGMLFFSITEVLEKQDDANEMTKFENLVHFGSVINDVVHELQKENIAKLGGKISVESEENKGSIFTVEFPRK